MKRTDRVIVGRVWKRRGKETWSRAFTAQLQSQCEAQGSLAGHRE
jgi:hypothetical protein